MFAPRVGRNYFRSLATGSFWACSAPKPSPVIDRLWAGSSPTTAFGYRAHCGRDTAAVWPDGGRTATSGGTAGHKNISPVASPPTSSKSTTACQMPRESLSHGCSLLNCPAT